MLLVRLNSGFGVQFRREIRANQGLTEIKAILTMHTLNNFAVKMIDTRSVAWLLKAA